MTLDDLPATSQICSAEMNIKYQMVVISSIPSLVPKTFSYDMDLDGNRSGISKTEFTDCHAFLGESSIHYTDLNDNAESASQAKAPLVLPNGITIHAALNTHIVSQDAYTGDPIEATLESPIKVRHPAINLPRAINIPKGAKLNGVITKLEFYDLPEPHYLLAIRLDEIEDGGQSYLMKANLRAQDSNRYSSRDQFRVKDRSTEVQSTVNGDLLFPGTEFQISPQTRATWVTTKPGGE